MKLKDHQKFYIRGGKDAKQGKRVVKELEKRGGVNRYNLSGMGYNCLYYIRPNGVIEIYNGMSSKLFKDGYTEVKVNE